MSAVIPLDKAVAAVSTEIIQDAKASPIPLNVKEAKFSIDITDLAQGNTVEIRVDASEDGGKTWHYFGSTTHDLTCQKLCSASVIFENGNNNPQFLLRVSRVVYAGDKSTPPGHRTPVDTLKTAMKLDTYV